MTDIDIKKAAKAFSEYWKDKGYEKGESQPFWLALLRDIFGVEHPEQYIKFEDQVMLDHTSFIDGTIEKTHVLIEQKGVDKNLRKPIKQADGSLLTPFQQAKRYAAELPYSKRPRWIIACNFAEFLIYDMEKPTGEPESILLKDLAKEYYRLQFLVEEKSELLHREEQISIQAGELVGKLYDAILKQYIHPDDKASLHSLNILCVRLVFCLYAEDSGIFGEHNKFHNYINSFTPKDVRKALIELFKVLDTKYEETVFYQKEDGTYDRKPCTLKDNVRRRGLYSNAALDGLSYPVAQYRGSRPNIRCPARCSVWSGGIPVDYSGRYIHGCHA